MVSEVSTRHAAVGPIPLIVEPAVKGSSVSTGPGLAAWLRDNKQWVDETLLAHGALLFRGFDLHAAEDFEAAATPLVRTFGDYAGGVSPRKRVTSAVSTSTEAPPFVPITLHQEMSYLDVQPERIMFFCEVPPEGRGQTPIADMRAFYNSVDHGIRTRLEEKGLRLISNMTGMQRVMADPMWPKMYGREPDGFVSFCREHGVDASWQGKDTMRLISERPASVLHPATGDRIWFNNVLAHDSYSWEMSRLSMPAAAQALQNLEKTRKDSSPLERPYHCTYGDGSEIPIEDVEYIRKAMWDNAVLFDWQRGDLLLLDNIRMAHGRMPFDGKRRVLAALSQSIRPAVC